MIGVGTSLLFDRRAGKAGPPIPPFNKAMVDAWFMSGLSNADKPSSIRGVKGNEMQLKNFVFTSESGFGEGNYEGALVFDGVDDYCICTGLPIMTDYTVICRRNILNELPGYIAYKAISDKGSFHFESRISSNNTIAIFSFGQQNRIKLEENEVSWMTRTSYNGIPINFGDASDTDQLHLCKFYNSYAKAAIYYFALYNKSLTPEEIEEEKVKLENYWEGGKNELA